MVVVSSEVQPGISTERAIAEGLLRGPRADVVYVLLGGNDRATSSYPETLRRAVAELSTRTSRVVWVGPMASARHDVDQRHRAVAEVQRDVLPGLGVAWVPGRPLSMTLPFQPDGVHFTPAGYTALAEDLVDVIDPSSSAVAIGTVALVALALVVAGLGASFLSR